jgi:hypothetical protein
MTAINAEEIQEVGRSGVINAKHLLWQILGKAIDLPFNAYDHRSKLTYEDIAGGGGSFSFDLGGVLRHKSAAHVGGENAIEVLVEVKADRMGNGLLGDYREFLRRAAIVSLNERHRDTWFIFIVSVPFGTTFGVGLFDGTLLNECKNEWPEPLKSAPSDLHKRITVMIATESFKELLTRWGRNEGASS